MNPGGFNPQQAIKRPKLDDGIALKQPQNTSAQNVVSRLVQKQAGDMMQQQQQQILMQQQMQRHASLAHQSLIQQARSKQQLDIRKFRDNRDLGKDTEIWLASAKRLIDKTKASSGRPSTKIVNAWPTNCVTPSDIVKRLVRGEVGLNTNRVEAIVNDDMAAEPMDFDQKMNDQSYTLRPHERLMVDHGVTPSTEFYLTGRLPFTQDKMDELLAYVQSVSDLVVGPQLYREQCFRTEVEKDEALQLLSSGSLSTREFWLRFSYSSLSPRTSGKTRVISSPTVAFMRTFNNAFDEADDNFPVSSRIVSSIRISQKKALALLDSPVIPSGGVDLKNTNIKYKLVSTSQTGYCMLHGFKFNPGTADEVLLTIETFHLDFETPIPSPKSIIVTATRTLGSGESTESAINSLMEISSKLNCMLQLSKI